MDRRVFLGSACSAAASPAVTPLVLAAAPGERRLVVIVLRGAMDALDVVQPYGDRALAALRPRLARTPDSGLLDLDGFFGLHPDFSALMPLWTAGELGFVHAVSTPYRDRRSHFDGQDLLENGGGRTDGRLTRTRDGWLNRALALIPGARPDHAVAVGQAHMLVLKGRAPADAWSPTNRIALSGDARLRLKSLYRDDPLFAAAFVGAERMATTGGGARRETGGTVAAYAARRLNGPARIAAFSIGGWDTHRRQDRVMRFPARQLSAAILKLKEGLGANWARTAVLAMTEFGRTARENGSRGTDHGTAGLLILAGGAVAGGQVRGRWPGLDDGALYAGRDLMPTGDLRRHAAWALAGQFGLKRSSLEESVFPGVEMGSDPGILG